MPLSITTNAAKVADHIQINTWIANSITNTLCNLFASHVHLLSWHDPLNRTVGNSYLAMWNTKHQSRLRETVVLFAWRTSHLLNDQQAHQSSWLTEPQSLGEITMCLQFINTNFSGIAISEKNILMLLSWLQIDCFIMHRYDGSCQMPLCDVLNA